MYHSGSQPNPHDQQFADLCRRKDPRAFALLWEYRPRLVLSIRRKFSAHIPFEDCEDLATNVIVDAYERGASFEPAKATLATWLNSRAHYHALTYLRARQCELPALETLGEFPASELVLAERIACEVPSGSIQQALGQITPVHAQAIQLFYYDGLTVPLIAVEMRVARSTVRSYLARGITQLRAILTLATTGAESDE